MRILGHSLLIMLSLIILSYGFSGAVYAQSQNQTISAADCGPNEIFRLGECIDAFAGEIITNPNLSLVLNSPTYTQGSTIEISGITKLDPDIQHAITLQIISPEGSIVAIEQGLPAADGSYKFTFIGDGPLWKASGNYEVKVKYGAEKASQTFDFTGGTTTVEVPVDVPPPPPPPPKEKPKEPEPKEPEPVDPEPKEPTCGPGTHLEKGLCVPDAQERSGCLIATAAFGSELAPQVQMLREIRDNSVLTTASGTSFMVGFNTLYYSFSPTIADLERESPIFKESVKAFITPMISTLSIMSLADEGSETDVLTLGISVIALNLGMYIAAPAFVAYKINKHLKSRK